MPWLHVNYEFLQTLGRKGSYPFKKKSLRGKNQMMIFNIHLFIEKIRHNLWVQGKPNYVTVANNGRYVGQHQLRKILIH